MKKKKITGKKLYYMESLKTQNQGLHSVMNVPLGSPSIKSTAPSK